ncbi:MAG: hypothetical protein KAR76_05695 [Methanosarcinales archaeon]|nr:hypothetical protein [Methanosarcinales archaeon]
MGKICIKDSVIEALIKKEMVLQRLYGNKEATEANLSLCEDDALLHKKLMKNLEHINHEISVFTSGE